MTKIYLVRHAKATEPGDLRFPEPERSLTAEGWREARVLAERLVGVKPIAVFTSDLRRARETAMLIAERCGVPVVATASLREVDFGGWAGRTYADIVAAHPEAARFFDDPSVLVPPHGEAAEVAARRVVDALHEAARAHPNGTVVVVGHAGSLRLGIAAVLGVPLASYWRLRLDSSSISVIDWTERGAIIEGWNDVGHVLGIRECGEDLEPSRSSHGRQ